MELTDATPAHMAAELNVRSIEFILLVNEEGTRVASRERRDDPKALRPGQCSRVGRHHSAEAGRGNPSTTGGKPLPMIDGSFTRARIISSSCC